MQGDCQDIVLQIVSAQYLSVQPERFLNERGIIREIQFQCLLCDPGHAALICIGQVHGNISVRHRADGIGHIISCLAGEPQRFRVVQIAADKLHADALLDAVYRYKRIFLAFDG